MLHSWTSVGRDLVWWSMSGDMSLTKCLFEVFSPLFGIGSLHLSLIYSVSCTFKIGYHLAQLLLNFLSYVSKFLFQVTSDSVLEISQIRLHLYGHHSYVCKDGDDTALNDPTSSCRLHSPCSSAMAPSVAILSLFSALSQNAFPCWSCIFPLPLLLKIKFIGYLYLNYWALSSIGRDSLCGHALQKSENYSNSWTYKIRQTGWKHFHDMEHFSVEKSLKFKLNKMTVPLLKPKWHKHDTLHTHRVIWQKDWFNVCNLDYCLCFI